MKVAVFGTKVSSEFSSVLQEFFRFFEKNNIDLQLFYPFKEFIKKELNGQKFIAHCEETDKKSLKSELNLGTDCTILIGPEGDFSVKEIQLALDNQYIPVSLGNTRLRTETAAIVACHSIVFANE